MIKMNNTFLGDIGCGGGGACYPLYPSYCPQPEVCTSRSEFILLLSTLYLKNSISEFNVEFMLFRMLCILSYHTNEK